MTSSTTTSALRVLVVDDHELTRCTLKLALEFQSHIKLVGVASNGREAIALVQQYQPDLVVLDLHMPIMDGWKTSQEIKRKYPQTKIVAYSAADGGKAQAQANGAVIDAFCEKGACTKSLLEVIRAIV
jgi:two-component system, NarL family, vancomycin resistance associated response regulator VraR